MSEPTTSLNGMPLQKSDASWSSAISAREVHLGDVRRRVWAELGQQLNRLVCRGGNTVDGAERSVDRRVAERHLAFVDLVVLDERRRRRPLVGQQAAEQPGAVACCRTDECDAHPRQRAFAYRVRPGRRLHARRLDDDLGRGASSRSFFAAWQPPSPRAPVAMAVVMIARPLFEKSGMCRMAE